MSYSRWMLCDLQVHTPADRQHRYGDAGGPEPNPEFAEKLIKAHADAGVELIAVTDHNTVAWWEVLDAAGRKHGVFVFPGVEVNVNKCHVLAIWERNADGARFANQFLHSLFDTGENPLEPNRTPKPVAKGNVLDLVKKASESRALVLAPHATMKKVGLFASNVCNVSSKVAQSPLMSGFDVIDSPRADVLSNPRSEFGDRTPAWFSSGDVRSIEEVAHRACFLKVGVEPSLESLRQAFLMPETRIRLNAGMRAKWGGTKHVQFLDSPTPDWGRIASIRIKGGFHDGLDVSFGPGLNAVIGGRGTGKSTLLEVLGFVLGSEPTEESRRRKNFPNNAEAEVGFVAKNGEEYVVHRAGSDASPTLRRGDAQVDVDVARRVEIQTFQQRQLYDLPKDPEQLRAFVLARHSQEVAAAAQTEDHARRDARTIAESIDALDAEVDKSKEWTEELRDVSDRLKRLTTPAAKKQIVESGLLEEADAEIQAFLDWPAELERASSNLIEVSEPPDLPDGVDLPAGFKSQRKAAASAIRRLGKEALKVANESDKRFGELGEQWDEEFATKRSSVDQLLADAGLANAEELSELQKSKTQLEKALKASNARLADRKALISQRKRAIDKLAEARRVSSRLVGRSVTELNEETGSRVRLTHEPLADKSEMLDFIAERILFRKVSTAQAPPLAKLDPRTVAAAALEGDEAVRKLGLTQSVVTGLLETDKLILRELEEIGTPDVIKIEVNVADTGDARWTDVTEASPGQAATALLELALIASSEPLIIDQPEDDLDNRFIYEEVVRKLAEVSSRRQVIVATHNANIPVLGDAELVLAFEAAKDHGRVLAAGGLDEPEVVATTRKILEGGEDAFDARAARYLGSS